MTLNKYLLSFLLSSEILQQINNILDHGIFGVSFYFLFMLLTPKRSKVLQMINNYYIAFLSLKVRVFMITPLPPPLQKCMACNLQAVDHLGKIVHLMQTVHSFLLTVP